MVTTDRVRCVRASTSEFEALTQKDGNTLYFVNENGSFSPESMEVGGLLYLGDKLINIDQLKGQGYGTCSSSASPMSVTMSGYSLAENSFVAVKFSNAVPANATMSINGETAKPIYNNGAAIAANVIKAGRKALFLYDGTAYNLISVEVIDGDNIKPDWEAASGSDAEILNKPNINRGGSSGNAATAIIEGRISGSNINKAIGAYSHAEGNMSFAVGEASHAEGGGGSKTIQLTGSGTSYSYVVPSDVVIKLYDVLNYGNSYVYVTALGQQNTLTVNATLGSLSSADVNLIDGMAYSSYSHVEGRHNNAIGLSAHAEGHSNRLNSSYGHIEGYQNYGSGAEVHVEGLQNKVTAGASHAEGYLNVVESGYSHVEGRQNKVLGSTYYYSHAEGYLNLTRANYAHVEGVRVSALANGSHAEGYGSDSESPFTVTGPDANGTYTTNAAHGMEGGFTLINYGDVYTRVTSVPSATTFKTASPLVEEGSLQGVKIRVKTNFAFGTSSHTENNAKATIGAYSHAEGVGTVTYNEGEHAEGRYNVSRNIANQDETRTRHSIGIGTGTGSNRKNAVEVMANGDYYLYNVGGYDGKTVTNKKTLQTVLSEHNSAIEGLQEGVAYFDRVKVGARGLLQDTLCAFNIEEELVSLVYPDPKGGTEPVANTIDRFPHGAKIYYYAGSDVTGNTNAYGLSLFATFKHADMRKMLFGATTSEDKAYIGATQSTAYVNQSALFLNVDADRYGWYIKVTDDGEMVVPYKYLEYGQTVIRLGCHNASATTDTDWYSMNLEDNNPMYRYEADDEEDPVLTEYHQAAMYDILGDIETALDVIINGQSGGGGGGNN